MCARSHIDDGPSSSFAPTEGITMPEGAQQGQAKQQRKSSPIIAGVGAALVASAVTVTLMMSNTSPVAVTTPSASTSTECQPPQLPDRTVFFSITEGTNLISRRRVESATVLIRAGDYVSGPIVLTHEPQALVLPLPPPGVEQEITIEGTTQDIVMNWGGHPMVSSSNIEGGVGHALFTRRLAPRKRC
jgi:hypothetical protein